MKNLPYFLRVTYSSKPFGHYADVGDNQAKEKGK
jgi:hypothetical protein